MNFYQHHIGDYAQATAHLTFVEDAAYSRMLRKYYADEQPLPADVKKVQRLVAARTKEEKEAVVTVLDEFFSLEGDGWHNKRCDEELSRAEESGEARDAKRAAERERQHRARERRKDLFEQLRAYGETPAFDTSTTALVTLLSRVTSRAVTSPVTGGHTANQTPITNNQIPNPIAAAAVDPAHADFSAPLAAADIAVHLIGWERERGKAARGIMPSNQQVIDLAAMSITGGELAKAYEAAVADRIATDDPSPINVGFVRTFVEKHRNPPKARPKPVFDDWHKTDAGTDRKARELGMTARGGESYQGFRDRIWTEIRKREGQPA